ncbi:unnamed protein product (macronuclear) [Paramecium tetraurelia]|uniref:EF-hand domain-containing protein n=1 Tax=Paramecium tetraurelia TaxID=5888 RepID=A0E5T6_PARTE|nr:uncharacterized protein GSPATT00003515001 [Paramecium tetraurelia]CAK90653.1 unnamed protein product [Paramecium tetraurelia]|eukprot:XP_001458050.1 hypothetical protein (macronuclear) [Paramecium tetraurelia strain d4-2]
MIDQESLLAELGLLDERKLLLELTIQLGQNEHDILFLYEGDDIGVKASQFCEKHHLKDEIKEVIAQNIKLHLNEKENYFSFISNVNTNKPLQNQAIKQIKDVNQEKKENKKENLNKSQAAIKKTDIYDKQVKQMNNKNNAIQKQRILKEEEAIKEATFKPRLNQNTLKLNNTPEYYLLKYGQQLQEQKKKAEQQNLNETSRECSFRPEINKISQKICDEIIKKDVSMTKFDQLYNQAKKRKANDKSSTSIIQESQTQYSKRSVTPNKSQNKQYLPFLERMEIQKKIKEEKLKQEVEESIMYDDKSGQKLFQPQVHSANRNRGGLSIGEYLYQQQKSINDESIIQLECDDLSKSVQTDRSNQIVIQMRRKKLEEYFKLMDSDNDGLISAQNIYLEELPTEALELLQPVILQLEKLDIFLNTETWTAKCLDIIEKMSIFDKNRLFQKQPKQQKTLPDGSSTFKPQLNQKSEIIAKQRQTFKGPAALYQKAMKENIVKEQKIKHFKEQQEQKEAKQCTFQPKIKLTNRSTTSTGFY